MNRINNVIRVFGVCLVVLVGVLYINSKVEATTSDHYSSDQKIILGGINHYSINHLYDKVAVWGAGQYHKNSTPKASCTSGVLVQTGTGASSGPDNRDGGSQSYLCVNEKVVDMNAYNTNNGMTFVNTPK